MFRHALMTTLRGIAMTGGVFQRGRCVQNGKQFVRFRIVLLYVGIKAAYLCG